MYQWSQPRLIEVRGPIIIIINTQNTRQSYFLKKLIWQTHTYIIYIYIYICRQTHKYVFLVIIYLHMHIYIYIYIYIIYVNILTHIFENTYLSASHLYLFTHTLPFMNRHSYVLWYHREAADLLSSHVCGSESGPHASCTPTVSANGWDYWFIFWSQ